MEYILYIFAFLMILAYFVFFVEAIREKQALLGAIQFKDDLISTLEHDLKVSHDNWQESLEHNKFLVERIESTEDRIIATYNDKMKAWKLTEEERIRNDALTRSRSVIRGQATEHLAPLMMPDLNLKDFRFVGNPVDYIVFSGVSDITDKLEDAKIDKVILLEIKSGKSKLNTVQRKIRDAIKEGKVEFVIHNPDTNETKVIKPED